jgi:hypothetical protein
MSVELDIYKQKRINNLKNIFNTNVALLNSSLIVNIKNINLSRFMTSKIKQPKINSLISQYKQTLNLLQLTLNNNITNVLNFKPNKITINNKKALLVGINYIGTDNELYGCINDVNSIKEKIISNGFLNNNINLLTDNTNLKPTKNNILNSFKNLLANSKEGDLLFFLYSGHGSYTEDKNSDETTGYDQMIVPLDLDPIVDDELKTIIQTYLKPNVTLFAMFDSCFSGSVLDLKYQYLDSLNYDNYTENDKQLETRGNVFMISGCNDYQTSADSIFNNNPNGAMTWCLLECLKQKPNCTWRELLKLMRELLKSSQYDQIPQFSCGKFENIDTNVFI